MDDPTIVALLTKSVLAALLILGGIIAIFVGKNLYLNGVGLQGDGTKVEIDKIKGSLKTVGSVVMATSVAWGYLGYLTSPSYSLGSDGEKVVTIDLPGSKIKATQFKLTSATKIDKSSLNDTKRLSELFLTAYQNSEKTKPIVTVDNQPILLQARKLSTWKTANKIYLINQIEAGNENVALAYKADIKGNEVVFSPLNIGVIDSTPIPELDNKSPN